MVKMQLRNVENALESHFGFTTDFTIFVKSQANLFFSFTSPRPLRTEPTIVREHAVMSFKELDC